MQTFTNNLIFSLNATIPIFLMMALGFFLQRIHLLDDHTTQKLNQFAFKVLLPALLFMDLSTADFSRFGIPNLYCFVFVLLVLVLALPFYCRCCIGNGQTVGNLFRQPTAAVLQFWESPLSRTFMAKQPWQH